MMTALEMVNMRVNYQVDVHSRESSEFHSRHHDAQKDHAAVRAEIEPLARSEAHSRCLIGTVTVLETEVHRMSWNVRLQMNLLFTYHATQPCELEQRDDTLEGSL
ncbi:hypothetical protein Tco_1300629 [Tanacetum coccineum]